MSSTNPTTQQSSREEESSEHGTTSLSSIAKVWTAPRGKYVPNTLGTDKECLSEAVRKLGIPNPLYGRFKRDDVETAFVVSEFSIMGKGEHHKIPKSDWDKEQRHNLKRFFIWDQEPTWHHPSCQSRKCVGYKDALNATAQDPSKTGARVIAPEGKVWICKAKNNQNDPSLSIDQLEAKYPELYGEIVSSLGRGHEISHKSHTIRPSTTKSWNKIGSTTRSDLYGSTFTKKQKLGVPLTIDCANKLQTCLRYLQNKEADFEEDPVGWSTGGEEDEDIEQATDIFGWQC